MEFNPFEDPDKITIEGNGTSSSVTLSITELTSGKYDLVEDKTFHIKNSFETEYEVVYSGISLWSIIEEENLLAYGRCIMCGNCTNACINNLSVNDIVRVVDYYTDRMSNIDLAKENYRSISSTKNALNCLDCGACELVCQNNVAIRSLIKRAKVLYS